MVLLGVLLAVSLATTLAVLVAAEIQERSFRRSSRVILLPVDERARFEQVVAPLLEDPDFGRLDH
jgi:hypothetical protein